MFAAWKHRRAIRRAYGPLWRGHLLGDFRWLRKRGCKNPMKHYEALLIIGALTNQTGSRDA